MKIKRLHKDAIIPTRTYATDAGLDIYACEDVTIPTLINLKGEDIKVGQARVPTGIAVEIPAGYYGKISSRSGLAFKHGIFSFDGTIDSGYTGEIGVLLYNTVDKPFKVSKGDRIAQLLIIPCVIVEPEEVQELDDSERGAGGFGSSGY